MEPYALRPLDFGEILDRAFSVYRRRFVDLVLAVLVPLAAATAAIHVVLAPTGSALLGGLVTVVAFLVASGAVAYLVGEAYMGRSPSAWDALAVAGSCAGPLFGATILAWLLVGLVGLVLFVPAIIVSCMFFGVLPVVILERALAGEALSRSRALSRGALGRIFGVLLVAMLVFILPRMALAAAVTTAVVTTGFRLGTTAALVLMNTLTALTLPVSVGMLVVLYFDRRVRAEALDVQLAAEELDAG